LGDCAAKIGDIAAASTFCTAIYQPHPSGMKEQKPPHLQTGITGEALAAVHLRAEGFRIIEQNWRYGRLEVDIIAEKQGVLHFIEVKTRRSKRFGRPEEQVNGRKIEHLAEAASEYLYRHPQWQRIQFDVLAITLGVQGAEFFFIEDVSR
jgi:putative endonuclease